MEPPTQKNYPAKEKNKLPQPSPTNQLINQSLYPLIHCFKFHQKLKYLLLFSSF